jgi:hypothetical protein
VTAQTVACCLYEPDGALLAAGVVQMHTAAQEAVVTGLDRPGQIVQRCLLGGLRELRLRLEGSPPITVRIERVTFDPKLGRVCTLRM